MRIALITHNVVRHDGQGRVNYEIARNALARGAEVWLLADEVDVSLVELGAVHVRVRPRVRWPQLLKVREFAARAGHALENVRSRLDVIHGNGFSIDRPHHVNTSHFVHGAWVDARPSSLRGRRAPYGVYQRAYSRLNARWERSAYANARVIVAVSDRIRDDLLSIGVSSERVRIVRNGVDLTQFRPGAGARDAFGLPSGVPIALFVGDLRSPRKNLDTLLEALVAASSVHLAVVGSSERTRYPELAHRLGLSDRVHFLGFRHDVEDVVRAVDMFVSVAWYEPFSLALLEALASGLPVIAAQKIGAAELVTPECGVVLPDPGDPIALAAALEALANDARRREAMGVAARRVAEQYGWESVAEAYLRVYEEVAG